ncbi:gliding motility-associated protein GldE [Pseudofulvibacter geojedonensis]|uniref:Gliding motility-associated protein GldE n=1 Tax=Pseudofulvibacter geojedonensis TaxID=1123758 RepID=A0ABW3I4H1_9FLAO
MDPDSQYFVIGFLFIASSTLIGFVGLLFLLVCSALISGAEVAFFSLTQIQLEDESNQFRNRQSVVKLLANPKKLLATILVANNFINIAIVLLFANLFNPFFESINVKFDILGWFVIKLATVLKVGVATFLILLFGEILPKVYASRNNEKFSGFMAKPLLVMTRFFRIFSYPMQTTSTFLEKRLAKTKSNISVNELSQALELTCEKDTTVEEQKMLEGIVSFGNTDTSQVMCPRIDIFALDIQDSFTNIIKQITKAGFSRIPVYTESLDKIEGVLYVKDLLSHIDKNNFKWQNLIREPFFVPENKKLDDLLNEFQEKKVHLAIVVDEYGGTSGVVSLEDIIEEIVGDISDEFDDDHLVYSQIDDNNYVFEGKTSLKDLYKVTNVDTDLFEEHKGEAETIAGFVLEISGSFPKKNEKITFHDYQFTVELLDKKRIKQLKLTLPE